MLQHQLLRGILVCLLLIGPSVVLAEALWIDVRSAIEHSIDSIEGDIRISHDNILRGIEALNVDKSTPIKLYCRSGGRAGKALKVLQQAGYENVSNEGGIEDARKTRGLLN